MVIFFVALEAISTGVIAWLAMTQWRGDTRKTQARVREIDSRLSTLGFQLRRQLRSWLGTDTKQPADRAPVSKLNIWYEKNKLGYKDHLDRAEQRLEEMASLAGEASSERAVGVKIA